NLESLTIASNQERRMFECDRILLKLGIGGCQVLFGAFVLPAEGSALPYVSPSIAAGRFGGAFFKAIAFGIRSGVVRCIFIEEMAKVDEVSMRCLSLGERIIAPFSNEFVRGHVRHIGE